MVFKYVDLKSISIMKEKAKRYMNIVILTPLNLYSTGEHTKYKNP
jgi:hypothetical protein